LEQLYYISAKIGSLRDNPSIAPYFILLGYLHQTKLISL
jgi:hypothetical protein